MIIYHVCHIDSQSNGVYSVLCRLTESQRELKHEVRIFNFCSKQIENQNFELCTPTNFRKILKANKPDLVIFHGILYKAVIQLSHILWKEGTKYLIQLHGALSFQNMQRSWLKKTIIRKIILDKIIKKATAIIYLNQQEYCNSTLRELNAKSIIVPNGCDLPNNSDVKKICANKTIEYVFIGRIDVNHKGLDILISAIKELQKNGNLQNMHFSFYGTGAQQDIYWITNELSDLKEIADFYGPVYGKDKESVLMNANIFMLTSRYEGFPMSILEALAHGIPCLISPMTNVSDIISKYECGWITLLDVNHISNSILTAKEEFSNKRMRCLDAASNYDWHKIAEHSIREYQSVLI